MPPIPACKLCYQIYNSELERMLRVKTMIKKNSVVQLLLTLLIICSGIPTHANSIDELKRLKDAYPECIQGTSPLYIAWKDGTRMPIKGSGPLIGWLAGLFYSLDNSLGSFSSEETAGIVLSHYSEKCMEIQLHK